MNRDTSPPRSRKFCLSRSTMGLDGDNSEARDLHSGRCQQQQQQHQQQQQPQPQQPCPQPKEKGGKCTCPLDDSEECVETCQTFTQVTKQHSSLSWLPSLKLPSWSSSTSRTKQDAAVDTALPPPPSSSPQCVTSTEAIATSHYRAQLEKYKKELVTCGCDAAQLNCKLNDIFLKRLEDVDEFSNGDTDLRLVTYQEWVELLLHINATILGNINDMENETNQRIRNCFMTVNHDRQDSQDENRKLRKDVCTLIRIIQTAYNNNNKNGWNFKDIHFETLDLNYVLGIPKNQCPVNHVENDTDQNVKALTAEIAEKYDEICSFRSQIMCLEKEIQTAHQKIILKDETIACLREKLDQSECLLSQYREKSGCELCSPQKLEVKERDAAELKVAFYREHLLALDNFPEQNESSNSDLDQDIKIVQNLSKRLSCLSESYRSADIKNQELEMQMRALQNHHDSNLQKSSRNDIVLKELAEMISHLTGVDFAYDSIYNGDNSNPFCGAFIEMYEKRVSRESYEEIQREKTDLHKTTKST